MTAGPRKRGSNVVVASSSSAASCENLAGKRVRVRWSRGLISGFYDGTVSAPEGHGWLVKFGDGDEKIYKSDYLLKHLIADQHHDSLPSGAGDDGQRRAAGDYEVEQIIDRRGTEYLVRWAGYGPAHDTWEPLDHLGGAQAMIASFDCQQREKQRESGACGDEAAGADTDSLRQQARPCDRSAAAVVVEATHGRGDEEEMEEQEQEQEKERQRRFFADAEARCNAALAQHEEEDDEEGVEMAKGCCRVDSCSATWLTDSSIDSPDRDKKVGFSMGGVSMAGHAVQWLFFLVFC
jgi:hypothetical protein|eukprot:COSAG01_NODE_1901_length_8963_cov_106.596458_10_plen_293_part_00